MDDWGNWRLNSLHAPLSASLLFAKFRRRRRFLVVRAELNSANSIDTFLALFASRLLKTLIPPRFPTDELLDKSGAGQKRLI